MNELSIEEALRDLAHIRRLVEQQKSDPHSGEGARRVFLAVQAAAFGAGFSFLLVELFSGGLLTELLLRSRSDRSSLIFGLLFVAICLIVLLSVLQLILRKGAARTGEEYRRFLAENEPLFRNLSLSADLLVKFLTFSLIVVAPRPEWIGPLLMIFTGDYLLNGRLFHLPFRSSLLLGVLIIGAGLLQLQLGSVSLLPALVGWSIASGFSFVRALRGSGMKNT